jgi:hypothetical protein
MLQLQDPVDADRERPLRELDALVAERLHDAGEVDAADLQRARGPSGCRADVRELRATDAPAGVVITGAAPNMCLKIFPKPFVRTSR